MPIYEYQCGGCAHKFEVKQSMKDDPIAICARCGKQAQRLISSPAIMFKGSGWYITDYSDKLKPPTDGEAAEKGTGEKKDSTAPPATAPTSTTPAPAASSTPAAPSTTTTPSTSTTTPATSTTSTK